MKPPKARKKGKKYKETMWAVVLNETFMPRMFHTKKEAKQDHENLVTKHLWRVIRVEVKEL